MPTYLEKNYQETVSKAEIDFLKRMKIPLNFMSMTRNERLKKNIHVRLIRSDEVGSYLITDGNLGSISVYEKIVTAKKLTRKEFHELIESNESMYLKLLGSRDLHLESANDSSKTYIIVSEEHELQFRREDEEYKNYRAGIPLPKDRLESD